MPPMLTTHGTMRQKTAERQSARQPLRDGERNVCMYVHNALAAPPIPPDTRHESAAKLTKPDAMEDNPPSHDVDAPTNERTNHKLYVP